MYDGCHRPLLNRNNHGHLPPSTFIPWRVSISRPIASVSSVAGGDDTYH
jgi:hypothetical protein